MPEGTEDAERDNLWSKFVADKTGYPYEDGKSLMPRPKIALIVPPECPTEEVL